MTTIISPRTALMSILIAFLSAGCNSNFNSVADNATHNLGAVQNFEFPLDKSNILGYNTDCCSKKSEFSVILGEGNLKVKSFSPVIALADGSLITKLDCSKYYEGSVIGVMYKNGIQINYGNVQITPSFLLSAKVEKGDTIGVVKSSTLKPHSCMKMSVIRDDIPVEPSIVFPGLSEFNL